MGYLIRSGRGKAKPSEAIKTDEDAKKLMTVLIRSKGEDVQVELSTGNYTVTTSRPDVPTAKSKKTA